MESSPSKIRWSFCEFKDLDVLSLQALHMLRQSVFVVEQNCAYQDADLRDLTAWHLLGWQPESKSERLVAVLRVTPPGTRFQEWSIGRVATALDVRRTGAGRALMNEAIRVIEKKFGQVPIRISAQAYLQKFYEGFGFKVVREPYLEDNQPHTEMLREFT